MNYLLRNDSYNEERLFTIPEIILMINEDRSDEWTNYDLTDWKEGLENFTDWIIVSKFQQVMK